MDKLIEVLLVFLPQLLFIFLIGGFMKQDINAIFYIPKYENPKFIRLSNHLYLFTGFIIVSVLILPISIILYVNGEVTNFYDVLRLLIAGNGIVFIITFVGNYLFRNISYNEGNISHKTFLGSTSFYADKITSIELRKGFIFMDIVLINNKREIVINSFCSNISTLLYLVHNQTQDVVTEEMLNELYESNKFYKNEKETIQRILEVKDND